MPVPVTPAKSSLGEAAPTGANVTEAQDQEPLPIASTEDPCVVAGYQECLRETIRFLVDEEHLPVGHPVISGLSKHLTPTTAHQELEKISSELASTLNEDLKRRRLTRCPNEPRPRVQNETDTSEDSGLDNTISEDEEEGSVITVGGAKAYQISLEEVNSEEEDEEDFDMEIDSDDEMEEDEDEMEEMLVTAQDILANQTLRRELIRLVFQGCDLVAAPNSQINLSVAES